MVSIAEAESNGERCWTEYRFRISSVSLFLVYTVFDKNSFICEWSQNIRINISLYAASRGTTKVKRSLEVVLTTSGTHNLFD